MAGSRAASAREPGQIREEAALSDTARAPRTSLAGVEERRARPRTGFENGCTVRFFFMSNADLIRTLTDMWNSGEVDGVFDLYTEDAEIRTGPHWPEVTVYRGRDEIRRTSAEWASMWEDLQIELHSMEEFGDRMVATGAWRMRGAASGIDGEMPIFILFTFREGKIAVLEWFEDRDTAVAAAVEARG
jgi:ketosteroid isomerase-like protein